MKHLVILRHGDYHQGRLGVSSEVLTKEGMAQFVELGQDIQSLTDNASAYIICSPAPRVFQSAQILDANLRVVAPPEELLFLWDSCGIPSEWRGHKVTGDDTYFYMGEMEPEVAHTRLEGIVNERADKADTLIIVSHKDLVPKFTSYYTKKHFGKAVSGSFEYGQGVLFDVETQNGYKLPLPI